MMFCAGKVSVECIPKKIKICLSTVFAGVIYKSHIEIRFDLSF